jgi:Tfp pilus assembly protein PilN
MDLRTLLAFGTGIGIEIRARDLAVTLTHVRPTGVRVAASTVIQDFRERPAGEWGSEYLRFLREHGASHLAATVVAPKREVIVRQIALPGVANKDMAAAVGYQVETLHPYGEDEIAFGWQRVSENGTALIGIIRRAALEAYMEKFAEAGVSIACFTFSAAALHGAARLFSAPPTQGVLATAEMESGEIEVYGESPSRPVFSAQFDLPADRAAALAAAELRLPPETVAVRIDQILPSPVNASGDFDFSRSTMPYAASLAGACPRLAAAANLLPEENRSANSRMIFVPSAILAALGLLVAGAVFGYTRIEERRYVASLEALSARLQPQVKTIAALDKSIEQARTRTRLLDEFRGRSKYDLDTLNELTKLLAPPIWTNYIEVGRDAVTLAGEAEQAAPLLRLLDSSPYFKNSGMQIPIVKTATNEMFRIRASRRPR